MTEVIEFTDRYGGGRGPSLWTICPGQCEGMGSVPIYCKDGDTRELAQDSIIQEITRDGDAAYMEAWREAEAKCPTDDGWHFVICPVCKGTGKTRGIVPRARQIMRTLGSKWEFARGHVLVRPYTSGTAALAQLWQKDHVLAMVEMPVRPDNPDLLAAWEVLEREWESPRCPFAVGYGDRLDVPRPWVWNRKLSLRVLFGRMH